MPPASPYPAPDDRRFSDAEVELLRTVELAVELFDDAATMQLLRVIGWSVSRIADAAVSTFVTTIGARSVAADAATTALAEANEAAITLFPQLSEAMANLLRQHLIDAARPTISASTAGYDRVVAALASSMWSDQRDSPCSFRWRTSDEPSKHSSNTPLTWSPRTTVVS